MDNFGLVDRSYSCANDTDSRIGVSLYVLFFMLANEPTFLFCQLHLPFVLRRSQDLIFRHLRLYLTECDYQFLDVSSQPDLIALGEWNVSCLREVLLVELQFAMGCQAVRAFRNSVGTRRHSDFALRYRLTLKVRSVWKLNLLTLDVTESQNSDSKRIL